VSSRRYRVELAPAAERELRKLPADATARLRGPILALGADQRPPRASALGGTPFLRLRVGDLRAAYLVDDPQQLVVVLRVARRDESTYRRIGRS
jgi:mRNA interferase RelE/StbE